ncbi:hypothetical protein F5Y10DRAFT_243779 [Nemania abortiva]|nr:hypothetical protein F5Y10DRAFT_243779 [Nemania abortiva]
MNEAEPLATRMATPTTTSAYPTNSYQYRSVSEESRSDLDYRMFKAPASNPTEVSLTWRPFYLRRVVLLAFITIFILIIITIEILLVVSNKNSGIATGNAAQHYLWTYGPTAFLTAIAALWARTEYQSKLVAPWVRLSQHAIPVSRTLLLDYISPLSLFTLFNSWRNKDHIVSITVAVSTLIKVVILISSGLISLSLTSVSGGSHPMVLQDRFVDNNTRLATTGNLASYIIHGLAARNLTPPEGISGNYAFQSVQTNLPTTVETRVIVDGFINSLDCEVVDIRLAGASPPSHYDPRGLLSLNVTISSPDCNIALKRLPGVTQPSAATNTNSTLFARFDQVQCDGITGVAGKRILAFFGNITYHTDYAHKINFIAGGPRYDTVGVLDKSSQLLCTPNYAIERVEITRNGTHKNTVVPVQGTPQRTLGSVEAWDIMDAQFTAGQSGFLYGEDGGKPINVSMVPVEVDGYMELALGLQMDTGFQATSLFDPDILRNITTGYYRQIGAIIAKESLTEPDSTKTIGSATLNENRLIVRSLIAQLMVGLLAACVLLTTTALFLVPGEGLLPHSPNTLLNLVSILQHSRGLATQLSFAGASDDEHLDRYLERSRFQSQFAYDSISNQTQFCVESISDERNKEPDMIPQINSKIIHPIILHPASRITLCLSVVGLIIALELLLYKSNLEDGLGDIGSTYIHYTWTIIPALVFGALSMAFSAVDFEIRNLAPYMKMKEYVARDKFPQLELLDMTLPKAIYREATLRTPWASATTTAFLIASLFTTFSASLFQELAVPMTTSVDLMADQSFFISLDNVFIDDTSDQIASLILESNYTFPRFTYQDLAFPELVPTAATPFAHTLNQSSVSISAVVPALRATMDCRMYEPDQIFTNLTLNYDDKVLGTRNHFEARVIGELCNDPDGTNFFDLDVPSNVTYLTEVVGSGGQDRHIGSCSDKLFFWAKFDFGASPIVQHTGALGCNTSFEAVDVDATFLGTELDLDPRNPPRPRESTARNSTLSASTWRSLLNDYLGLASIDTSPQMLDTFFAALVTSPWAIPISALGDPSANADIEAAIKFQQGIIQAQRLTALRVPANQTNATLAEPIGPGDNDAQSRFNATVVDATSRRRVVQDAASTHILVALLAAALLLFIVGWAASPSTSVLPRKPTTIASAVALLAGGNLFSYLPIGGPWLPPEEIAQVLGGTDARVWMGWGNVPDEEGRLNGGENEAGLCRFGIFVVDEDERAAQREA